MDEIIAAAIDMIAAIEGNPDEFENAIDHCLAPHIQTTSQEKIALEKVVWILKSAKGILSCS